MSRCWKFQGNILILKKLLHFNQIFSVTNGHSLQDLGNFLQTAFVTDDFQLKGNNFFMNQAIALKFSAFVHHMSALNWQKNFGHYSISVPVAPSSMPKLLTPLATIFVEIFFQKKIWWGFGPIWVTPWKDFLISWKKWRFEIFRTSLLSR